MNTLFLLMAQYNGRAIIPVETVCKDYFSHLTPEKFLRKIAAGEIELPLVRIEASQKSAKGVHLQDLVDYLDRRRAAALKETKSLCA
ncbi:MAG: Pyocin activator protein PrtN [Xanthobacteraceae bacterium]|nr:MAG: Pyocin activator protein PrtN [Xanthobacteraceae bacterium]